MTERARIGRALLAAMREDVAEARAHVAGVDPLRLATAARYHGAAGYLHAALSDWGSEPDAREAVATVYHFGVGLAMRATADLAEAASVLDGAAVEWLVVKGPVVAERLYPDPGFRAYNDLDVVVRTRSFGRALEALAAAGNQVIDRNWRLLKHDLRGQVHLELRHGTLADLHWHLINRDRMPFSIDMDAIFERARSIELAGGSVRTLDAEDTLLHLCVHAYLGGGNKLGWLKDIERAIAVESPDWDEVVARARAWRIGLPVAGMLTRANRILAAGVPAEVPAALGSRFRKALDRAASRALHPERSTGGRSPSTLPARLLARTPATSAAVYARRLAFRVRRGSSHPVDPILAPGGGEEDRRAFLDRVARSSRE